MGKAGKKSNTPPKTDGNAPLPITHEKTIGIQQPQSISLGASISISRLLVRGGDLLQAIVTRLPRGRPREYDVEGIVRVAEDLIRDTDVDDNLDPFCVRVRRECKNKRPPIKTPRSRSRMREILRRSFDDAHAQAAKK